MKKLLLVLIAIVGISFAANAQNNGKAIGLRFGYGTEVSYQQPVGANRLEVDLGRLETLLYSWHYFTGSVTYQWLFDLGNVVPGLGWYVGPGAGAGWYVDPYYASGLTIGVGGIVGVDYKFANYPLQVSLDFRPFYSVVNKSYYHSFDYSTALGVRYTF